MRHILVVDSHRNRLVPSEPVFDIMTLDGAQTMNKSVSETYGSAAVIRKETVPVRLVSGSNSMMRSVALLHDYHNYNGIR